MSRKVKLLKAGLGGLPYPINSVIIVSDEAAFFAINAGAAEYAHDDDPITPVPEPPVMADAAKLATEAEKARREALTDDQRKREDDRRKAQEEAAKKAKEEADKKKAENDKAHHDVAQKHPEPIAHSKK